MMRSARDDVSAWASVLATMKSTPERPETIMLLTALPPAPPTPQTMMRGFNSLSSGAFRLIDMLASLVGRPPAPIGMRVFLHPRACLRRAPLTRLKNCPSATARPASHIPLRHDDDERRASASLRNIRAPPFADRS